MDTSDTDSLLSGEQDLPPVVPRRRLRLTWSPSHCGHPQVQAACGQQESDQFFGHQRWSSVNVSLMWAAAESSESTPVVDSFIGMASRIREPINSKRIGCKPHKQLRTGWESLRAVFRSWGIPATQPGNHISARAQEALLNQGCRVEVCVNVAIHMGRELYPQQHREEVPDQVHRPHNAEAPESSWSQLDEFDLAEVRHECQHCGSAPIICEGGCVRVSPSH